MIKAIAEIKSTSDKMYLDDLYRTYAKMLTKLALSIVHDNDCAADVVTTAMLSLFSQEHPGTTGAVRGQVISTDH